MIKTRLFAARKGDTDLAYTSLVDAIKQIARKEGITGFFKARQREKVV